MICLFVNTLYCHIGVFVGNLTFHKMGVATTPASFSKCFIADLANSALFAALTIQAW
jgi:hypothetical protein